MRRLSCISAVLALAIAASGPGWALSDYRRAAWPNTDFDKASVPLDEIISGGPPRDGIPPIDDPRFVPVAEAADLADVEPVIGVTLGGVAKADRKSVV